jgi:hypothetical protein
MKAAAIAPAKRHLRRCSCEALLPSPLPRPPPALAPVRPPPPQSGPHDATAASPDSGPTRSPPPLLPGAMSSPWLGPVMPLPLLRIRALRGLHRRSRAPRCHYRCSRSGPREAATPARREVAAAIGAPRCRRRCFGSRPCEAATAPARSWPGQRGSAEGGVEEVGALDEGVGLNER